MTAIYCRTVDGTACRPAGRPWQRTSESHVPAVRLDSLTGPAIPEPATGHRVSTVTRPCSRKIYTRTQNRHRPASSTAPTTTRATLPTERRPFICPRNKECIKRRSRTDRELMQQDRPWKQKKFSRPAGPEQHYPTKRCLHQDRTPIRAYEPKHKTDASPKSDSAYPLKTLRAPNDSRTASDTG